METLDSASTVHGIASLSNIQMRLENVRKMVYDEYVAAYSKLVELDNHEAYVTERDESVQAIEEMIEDIGVKISLKMNGVAPTSSPVSVGGEI